MDPPNGNVHQSSKVLLRFDLYYSTLYFSPTYYKVTFISKILCWNFEYFLIAVCYQLYKLIVLFYISQHYALSEWSSLYIGQWGISFWTLHLCCTLLKNLNSFKSSFICLPQNITALIKKRHKSVRMCQCTKKVKTKWWGNIQSRCKYVVLFLLIKFHQHTRLAI